MLRVNNIDHDQIIIFTYSISAHTNGLGSIQQSSSNGHRDVTIASNPLLLAATAAASSNNAAAGSNASAMIGFGSSANANIVSSIQNQAASSSTQSNQHMLMRFMQPTLDESDLAQLDRNRTERYAKKKLIHPFDSCSLSRTCLLLTNFHRSRFVQGLLLSTLSLDDENDLDCSEHAEHKAPESNLDTSNTTDVLASDSTASRQPSHDFNESKKKQETASRSDIPQHLTGKIKSMEIMFFGGE